MKNRTAAARILSASDLAAERSARVVNLGTGEIEFVVVVRYIGEPSAAKQFRTMRVRATDATVGTHGDPALKMAPILPVEVPICRASVERRPDRALLDLRQGPLAPS